MNVERTALEASSCKSAARDFAEDKEQKRSQSPLLSKIYLARSKVMHLLVQVAQVTSITSVQLLNLGGGLDASYAQYFSKEYVLDLPLSIERITAANRDQRTSTTFISCDLNNCVDVMSSLDAESFNWSQPTVVLMECVMSYLQPVSLEALLLCLSSRLTNAIFVAYDPMCARGDAMDNVRSLSAMMTRKFHLRGAPLTGTVSSTKVFTTRMQRCSWHLCRTYTMYQALHCLLLPEERSLYGENELFDEYASLQTLLNVYCVCFASNNALWYHRFVVKLLRRSQDKAVEADPGVLQFDSRVSRLYARLAVLESHVNILEERQALVQPKQENLSFPVNCQEITELENLGKVVVRGVRPDDIDQVIAMYTATFADFAAADKSVKKYVSFAVKQLSDLRRQSELVHVSAKNGANMMTGLLEHRLWVATKEGPESANKIMAMIGVKKWRKNSTSASNEQGTSTVHHEIVHFCVDTSAQRCGLGTLLLRKVIPHQHIAYMHVLRYLIILICFVI